MLIKRIGSAFASAFIVAALLVTGLFSASAQPNRPPILPELYYQRLRLAVSADGLTTTWQADGSILREHTAAPDLVVWQGRVWLYAIDTSFISDDAGSSNATAAAPDAAPNDAPVENSGVHLIGMRRNDDGTWSEFAVMLDFDGQPSAPSAVALEDGRLRLYFTDLRDLTGGAATSRVYSATSVDGSNFTLDDGVRIEVRPNATDVDVVETSGGWTMFLSTLSGLTAVATSEDGLTFTLLDESSEGSATDTTLLPDGTLQQFFCRASGLIGLKAKPQEGAWIDFGDTGLPGCDPSALRAEDGSWLMVYSDLAPEFADTTPPLLSATATPPPFTPPGSSEPPPGAPPRP